MRSLSSVMARVFAAFVLVALLYGCAEKVEPFDNSVTLRRSSVAYKAGSMFVSVKTVGEWSLSVEYENEVGAEWISLSKTSGNGSTNSLILLWKANDAEGARSARIRADFGDGTCLYVSLTQRGTASSQNGGEGFLMPNWPDYPGLKSAEVRGWMELPVVQALDGHAWVFHNMTVSSKEVRNYSIFYDASRMQPRWVAYPLNKSLIGSGTRTNDWAQIDPEIPPEYQPYTAESWRSGYARGHMLPSADRLRTAANKATFYPTNMTVQNFDMNGEIWANLESEVRSWASACDTLYVVTGCVPSSLFITDRKGNRVNKPESYWKALLRYNASGNPKYAGVAFWVENRRYENNSVNSSIAMTIAELEQKTGIDFFPNLPPECQDEAETKISSVWGLK